MNYKYGVPICMLGYSTPELIGGPTTAQHPLHHLCDDLLAFEAMDSNECSDYITELLVDTEHLAVNFSSDSVPRA